MYIQTDRLILRPILKRDKYDYFEIYQHQETCRYLLHDAWTLNDLNQNFDKRLPYQSLSKNKHIEISCVLKNKVIGHIVVWYTDMKETVELGYVFHHAYLHQGYATEALRAIIQYLFHTMKVHRIYTNMDARNISSLRLCQRVDMRIEAHFIQDYWNKGEWTDSYICGMLASDLK